MHKSNERERDGPADSLLPKLFAGIQTICIAHDRVKVLRRAGRQIAKNYEN